MTKFFQIQQKRVSCAKFLFEEKMTIRIQRCSINVQSMIHRVGGVLHQLKRTIPMLRGIGVKSLQEFKKIYA
jgi:hypothetical protein